MGNGKNKWNIREFWETGPDVAVIFLRKDFLGQVSHVTQQMLDERKIANNIQEKISNLQEAEKSRKLQEVSVAVTGHVAFEILGSIQNWHYTLHRRYRWDSYADRHELKDYKTQTRKRAKDSRCRGNLWMFLYEEFVN